MTQDVDIASMRAKELAEKLRKHLNKQLQDEIRERMGIPLVLAQCNIDDDNPCVLILLYVLTIVIKERATLCIRALLVDNEINQSLIRDMAAI